MKIPIIKVRQNTRKLDLLRFDDTRNCEANPRDRGAFAHDPNHVVEVSQERVARGFAHAIRLVARKNAARAIGGDRPDRVLTNIDAHHPVARNEGVCSPWSAGFSCGT